MEKEDCQDLQEDLKCTDSSSAPLSESTVNESEEENKKIISNSTTNYASTTKTVGEYNFSFVTVSPK